MQKDFIRRCLRKDPADRPTARELLFHPVLFEVHSLKLLAAHILVNTPGMYVPLSPKHYFFSTSVQDIFFEKLSYISVFSIFKIGQIIT